MIEWEVNTLCFSIFFRGCNQSNPSTATNVEKVVLIYKSPKFENLKVVRVLKLRIFDVIVLITKSPEINRYSHEYFDFFLAR